MAGEFLACIGFGVVKLWIGSCPQSQLSQPNVTCRARELAALFYMRLLEQILEQPQQQSGLSAYWSLMPSETAKHQTHTSECINLRSFLRKS